MDRDEDDQDESGPDPSEHVGKLGGMLVHEGAPRGAP